MCCIAAAQSCMARSTPDKPPGMQTVWRAACQTLCEVNACFTLYFLNDCRGVRTFILERAKKCGLPAVVSKIWFLSIPVKRCFRCQALY